MPSKKEKLPLSATDPEIAKQANGWDPNQFTAGSSKRKEWTCTEGHNFFAVIAQRTRGRGCPYCSGRYPVVGINDLKTTHPDLSSEAHGWDPLDFKAGSNIEKTWICPLGHLYKAKIDNRALNNSNCPYCSGKKVLLGFNDLQTTNLNLAKEADGWDPRTVSSFTERKMSWKCGLGHTWNALISARSTGNGCPVCANKQVLIGFNDLKSVFPEIAKEAYGWNPESVTSGSSKKLNWICSENHIWSTTVKDRTGPHKSGCPSCSEYGFSPYRDGYLYFIKHKDWNMLQIGITNSPDNRLNDHKKLGWDLLEMRGPMDGFLAEQWETAILKMLKAKGADLSNKVVAGKFDGYTEAWSISTFEVKSIKDLMKLTEEFEESRDFANAKSPRPKKKFTASKKNPK